MAHDAEDVHHLLTTHGRRLRIDGSRGTTEVDPDTPEGLEALAPFWTRATWSNNLFKQIRWLGLPIQQLPEDLVMLQEVFWDVRPDVVIETGVAGGGSVLFWSSLLALCGGREVVSVDVRVPADVRATIEGHPLGPFAHLVEGDSAAPDVVAKVRARICPGDVVLVVLDSDHSEQHVLAELDAYAPLVAPGSYVVVTDGVMQVLDDAPRGDPSWVHDNPLVAADAWLRRHPEFERDGRRQRLLATYLPGAWLRRHGELPVRDDRTTWGEPIEHVHAQREAMREECSILRTQLEQAQSGRAAADDLARDLLVSRTWQVGRTIVSPLGRLSRRIQGKPQPVDPVVRMDAQRFPTAATGLSDASRRYLDLLKRALTDSVHTDDFRPYAPDRDSAAHQVWRELQQLVPHDDVELVRRVGYDASRRAVGRDWPSRAETMVGLARLDNLQFCIESVHLDGVPGDVVETGVWRGGAAILARALLRELGDTGRVVWACDSFEGLPPPDTQRWPEDAGDRHYLRDELAVSLDEVRSNFERYGLLDEYVRFAKGWFQDTLPALPVEQVAVLRLDGDMYGSTMVALEALEPRVPRGGYVIVDDYGAIERCRRAVTDYREANGITDPIHQVDWTGAWWRKA